ncbi:MAG: LysR family transcriptional regulator [Lachnospirales bacterium]
MGYKDISVKQMEYFLAVANHLNFTAASKALYISQPTLSKQIALLEEVIDTKLFERSKRNVILTPAGHLLKDELTHILSQLDRVLDNVRFVNDDYKAVLKIGCLEGLDASDFLIKSVEYFKEFYPNVMISFEKHTFKELRRLHNLGDLDIIFTLSFEAKNDKSIICRDIWKASACVVVSCKNKIENKKTYDLIDFKNENFIMLSRESSPNAVDSIIALCNSNGFSPKISRYVPNVESMILSIEADLGVGVLDESVVISKNANVRKCPIIATEPVSIMAVWKKTNSNPAVDLFVNTLL